MSKLSHLNAVVSMVTFKEWPPFLSYSCSYHPPPNEQSLLDMTYDWLLYKKYLHRYHFPLLIMF